ncbi:hypothetical protein [uncultured Clostridium sp.]|uniref:hypothetical protein n=1 Tax=uncultured Clostridium sp. TaxID=59620 RepID=UPI0028EAF3FC|nr:hypothetical protein [uncultured Clostridium sp.]
MKKKKIIIYTLIIFIVGVLGGVLINSNQGEVFNIQNIFKSNDKNHKEIVSGYSFEITEKNVINKEFDGDYLNSFVTVALQQEYFSVNLEGIDSDSEAFIINPNTGDMMPMEYNNNTFSTNVSLENNITYGIILDYKLVGAITVVNDLNNIDKDKLFRDILITLGCGL